MTTSSLVFFIVAETLLYVVTTVVQFRNRLQFCASQKGYNNPWYTILYCTVAFEVFYKLHMTKFLGFLCVSEP